MPERLNLNVNIDKKSGFCGGVVSAVKKAEELLNKHGELYCVGQIVHNQEEVRRLEKKGLVTIKPDEIQNYSGKQMLFRAHGEPPQTYKSITGSKNTLTDATCPIVLRIQDQMREALNRGENLYLFGKKAHPETIGLCGSVDGKAVVIESYQEAVSLVLPKSLSLFTQTTKDPMEFHKIVGYLEGAGVEVKMYDTICRAVSNRKEKLQEFSLEHDVVLFVAGENSSNGKVLFKACKAVNEDTHFISSTKDISREWFKKNQQIGICGATSTPMWLMEDVKNTVLEF